MDITQATSLTTNARSGACYQGQTHGHEAFVLSPEEAKEMVTKEPRCREVIFPYLIADDLLGTTSSLPTRFVIDFSGHDIVSASRYGPAFERIKKRVLSVRQLAADEEAAENKALLAENPKAKPNRHHEVFLKRWWQLSWARAEMIAAIKKIPRYIVCGSITKRPIFEFVSPEIHPNAALTVFPLSDDYSFGILQSFFHWLWFKNRCSTMKADPRYTSNTVFDSYPWPQSPNARQVKDVAQTAENLRTERRAMVKKHGQPLRELYRTLELPGNHPLKRLQLELDETVRNAYGMSLRSNPLVMLMELNETLAASELKKQQIVGPGLPKIDGLKTDLVSADCLRPL